MNVCNCKGAFRELSPITTCQGLRDGNGHCLEGIASGLGFCFGGDLTLFLSTNDWWTSGRIRMGAEVP